MSNENEPLELYKKLYSEYIALAVTVHNYHQVFIDNVGLGSGRTIRASLAKMINLEKAMRHASQAAYKQQVANTRAERQRLKELRAKAKPRKMPIYKGKNKNDNQ